MACIKHGHILLIAQNKIGKIQLQISEKNHSLTNTLMRKHFVTHGHVLGTFFRGLWMHYSKLKICFKVECIAYNYQGCCWDKPIYMKNQCMVEYSRHHIISSLMDKSCVTDGHLQIKFRLDLFDILLPKKRAMLLIPAKKSSN